MDHAVPISPPAGAADDPVESIDGGVAAGVLFLCDHAANALPKAYRTLGLAREQLDRHIAYDIGAAWITRRLARGFGAPAILARFSRLLIDPNRGGDDPTLVMRLSDGDIIPGNATIGAEEIEYRRAHYWKPYRAAIAATIDSMLSQGPPPAVVSIHTFTPSWKARPRPWEVGILWDSDPRFAKPLIAALAKDGFLVGDNEPYDGALIGDTLDEAVTSRGLAGLLIEARQDLVATNARAVAFADRLARTLAPGPRAPRTSLQGVFPKPDGAACLSGKTAGRIGIRGRIAGIIAPCVLTARGGGGIAGFASKRSAVIAGSRAAPSPNKGMFQMTADVAETGVAARELTQFVERVERLEEEKKAISDDIREVYAEMKGGGFDVRAVREIVKIRKQDHSERKELEAILELYMAALNMT